MPRSTFVGFRCLERQAGQRANHTVWPKSCRAQWRTRPENNGSPKVDQGDVLYLLRGRKNVQFASDGVGLRRKGAEGLRLRTRASVLKTLCDNPTAYQESTRLISAPVFLAPIIAFLKSSSVLKASATVVAFLKGTFIAKLFTGAVAYLKSGTVFKAITTFGRISLGVIASLRLQGKRILRWWHGSKHFDQVQSARKAEGGKKDKHFRRTTLLFFSAPVAFLVIAILASLERTPIWGRWRVIMMSTDEEALLVEEFLRPGSPPGAHLDNTTARDWLAILRAASDEEAAPPGTLMGMPVLDPNTDWRARWVVNVFSQLEHGVKRVNLTSDRARDGAEVLDIGSTSFAVSPVEYPLTIRPAALKHHGRSEDERVEGPLITRYGCLVVESPVCNAFSLGFGPALHSESNKYEEAPGVVVVFTGLLDEILRGRDHTAEPDKPASPASSALFGVFKQAVAAPPQYPDMSVVPTKHESDLLASTLAHELGHLLLSHSLESWASNNTYELLGTFAIDVIRTALYPLTAFLGPVFNDWFGEQIRINSALGLRVTSSCASRAAEIEADLVGLRILLGAGIDPRVALNEWAVGGLFDRAEHRESASNGKTSKSGNGGGSREDDDWLNRTGFASSHPMNEERYRRISEELKRWQELGRTALVIKVEAEGVADNAEKRRLPNPEEVFQTSS